jgi:UDP-glucose 4-epimerase
MKDNNVVVTGGAGFIGSNLVDFLVKNRYYVKVIDNLSSGRIENINHRLNQSSIEFFNLDISDYNNQDKITSIVKDCKWIFHLAALADIVPSIINPIKYHRSNVDGTINILEAARPNKIKKFVYIASSSCYGIPEIYPTPEYAPIKTEYPYSLTKYIGEQYTINWGKIYNIPVVSLRLFNVYGPRARTTGTYGAVFGIFLSQKLHNKPFTVVGDGKQTRDFTFVEDISKGIFQAAQTDISNEIINLGSGSTYSVNELTRLLGGEVIHIPKRPGEPDCTYADISKAKKLLGYNPQVSFEEGVKIMLKHINDWKDAPVWTPEKIDKVTKDWFKYLSK